MGRPTVKQAIEAIERSGGFVSTAARKLDTSRTTLHAMINKYPKLKTAVEDAREAKKDHAEGKLLTLIDEGNITAIIFYLKTQGKDRGYVERQEFTGKDGESIKTEDVTLTDDDRIEKLAAIFDKARARASGQTAE